MSIACFSFSTDSKRSLSGFIIKLEILIGFVFFVCHNIKWRILHYSAPTGMNKPELNLMGYTMEKDSFNSFFGVAKIVILSNLTK